MFAREMGTTGERRAAREAAQALAPRAPGRVSFCVLEPGWGVGKGRHRILRQVAELADNIRCRTNSFLLPAGLCCCLSWFCGVVVTGVVSSQLPGLEPKLTQTHRLLPPPGERASSAATDLQRC